MTETKCVGRYEAAWDLKDDGTLTVACACIAVHGDDGKMAMVITMGASEEEALGRAMASVEIGHRIVGKLSTSTVLQGLAAAAPAP